MTRKAERDSALVELWTERLREAVDAKETFDEAAVEVEELFTGEPDPFFDSEVLKNFLDVTNCPQATVNIPFQIRSWLGPNLYQRNPTRTVTSRTKDSILSGLGQVIGAWLNYTPGETGLAEESRLAVDEALIDGRACAYTGYSDTFGMVTSWFVSIRDVLIDPGAKRPKDAYWIALRRTLPRWELEKEFKDSAKDLPETALPDTIANGTEESAQVQGKRGDGDEDDCSSDVVTFYEVYSRMGTGWRGSDVEEPGDDSFDYKKIVLVPGFEKPLYVGRWETPLYVDGIFPLTFLDLTPTKNSLWPVSLIKAALPSLRAVNLLSSISLEKAKQHARELFFVWGGLDDDQKEQIASGGLSEVIEVKGSDQVMGVEQLVKRWESGAISPEIEHERQFHLNQIGEVTGLLPILKGQSSEQQIRSATEADIQDRNARSRLQDLSERVEDWATRLARNEGLLCRLTMDADEVSRYLDANVELELGYRIVVKTFGGVPLPTRLYAPGSDVDPTKEKPCLQGLAPEFARYFPDPQSAQEALAMFLAVLPQAQQAYAQRTGTELYLERDMQTGSYNATVGRVRVDDVWIDTAYLGPADLAREISFRIEAGSTKRPDANKKIDQANTLMASVAQPALQMGDVQTYNRALSQVYEAQGFAPKDRILLDPEFRAKQQAAMQQQAQQQQQVGSAPAGGSK